MNTDNSNKYSYREQKRQKIRELYQQLPNDDLIYIPARKQMPVTEDTPKKRACAYCRVSTDDPAQTTSYELQKEHYEEQINKNPDWIFAGIYADEGISATSMKHRDNFNRMIADAEAGKIDVIVTKAVSRFARNVVDCLSVVRRLAALNPPVEVIFETEGIHTLDNTSEMILAVMAAAAQEESKTKSNSMNWSLENRFKKGKFLTPVLLGYDHDEDGNLVVNSEEAQTVRLVYLMYLCGFSMSEIAHILTDMQRRTKLNNTKWSYSTVRGLIMNERYCGNVLSWKTYTYDFWEHKKRKNNHDKPQVMKVDHHKAIVSHEIYDAAQLKIASEKYSHKGLSMPSLDVIDEGILIGFVSVNRLWKGFTIDEYLDASNSATGEGASFWNNGDNYLKDYRVISGNLFSCMRKPAVTFSKGKICFNTMCHKKFATSEFVELFFNPIRKQIAVRPASEDNPNAIRWGNLVDGKWKSLPKSISGFGHVLYGVMNWSSSKRYKIIGQYISDESGQAIVFSLETHIDAVCFVASKTETGAGIVEQIFHKFSRPVKKTINQINVRKMRIMNAPRIYKMSGSIAVKTMQTIKEEMSKILLDMTTIIAGEKYEY